MTDEPWWPFTKLRYSNPDDALREIAAHIRAGCSDPTFQKLLAAHIDPDVKSSPFGTKLVLKRTTGRKAPPSEPAWELRRFLELHLDIFDDEKAEAVKAEAARRFGVSVSTCKTEIKVMRDWQMRDPEAYAERKDQAWFLRELGDPEHQPLWSDKSDLSDPA